MENKVFTIVPASTSTYLVISGIFLLMLIPFIALGYSCYQNIRPFNRIAFIDLLGLAVIIIVGGIFIYFCYSMRHTEFVLSEHGLRIKGTIYGREIPIDSFIAKDMQIVDLIHNDNYRPAIRTNGVGLPGYQQGWFRLKSGEKALLFLTKRTGVVYIPTRNGYSILLSVAEPKEFFEKAQQLWLH